MKDFKKVRVCRDGEIVWGEDGYDGYIPNEYYLFPVVSNTDALQRIAKAMVISEWGDDGWLLISDGERTKAIKRAAVIIEEISQWK